METLLAVPAMRRVLVQQGVGGRARGLRNRMLRRVLGLLALVVGLGMIHVWSRMQVLTLRYRLTGAQARVEQLRQQVNRLELQAAAQLAPDRLEQVAKTVLGLQLPLPGQVVIVQEGSAAP